MVREARSVVMPKAKTGRSVVMPKAREFEPQSEREREVDFIFRDMEFDNRG